MLTKFLEFTKSTLAFIALASIVIISTLATLALNPREYSPEFEGGRVAGVEDVEINGPKIPFTIKRTTESDKVSTLFDYNSDTKSYVYTASFLSAEKGKFETEFIEVKNHNEFNSILQVIPKSKGTAVDNFKIRVLDELDTVIAYDLDKNIGAATLTIPKLNSRKFKIEYEFVENINYPFEIVIELGVM